MPYNLIAKTIPAVTGGLFDFEAVTIPAAALLQTPAAILAAYIIDQGIGSMTDPADDLDWPLYIAFTPDNDNTKTDLGVVYDTTGLKDGRLMVSGEVVEHQGVQIKIRSRTHLDGWNKLDAISRSLDAVFNDTVIIGANEFLIQNIKRSGLIIPLGVEKGTKNRRLFTANFLLTLGRII